MTAIHWHILGAGAMGCLWAAQLHRNHKPCTLLVRPAAAAGTPVLRLTEQGQTWQLPVPIEDSSRPRRITHLLLAVKAHQALAAVQMIKSQLNSDSCLVLLQNGMGSQQQVTELCQNMAIYGAASTQGARLIAPLHTQRAGHGLTWTGPFNQVAQQRGTSALDDLTRLEGMEVRLQEDIHSRLLDKLAINAAINAMTVLHDCSNGALLQARHRDQLRSLCQETANILAAAQQQTPQTQAEPLLDSVLAVLADTRDNLSSSLQDVRRGSPTELRWINGWLLEQAARLGQPAPTHRALLDALAAAGIQ